MTPQISASISAASIRELLFLDTQWTAGTVAWPAYLSGSAPDSFCHPFAPLAQWERQCHRAEEQQGNYFGLEVISIHLQLKED